MKSTGRNVLDKINTLSIEGAFTVKSVVDTLHSRMKGLTSSPSSSSSSSSTSSNPPPSSLPSQPFRLLPPPNHPHVLLPSHPFSLLPSSQSPSSNPTSSHTPSQPSSSSSPHRSISPSLSRSSHQDKTNSPCSDLINSSLNLPHIPVEPSS